MMATYPNLNELLPEAVVEPETTYSSSDSDSDDSENFESIDLDDLQYDAYGELIQMTNSPPNGTTPSHAVSSAPPAPSSVTVTSSKSVTKVPERKHLILRRNPKGKLGIKLRRMGKSVYFSFVEKGSPAAQAGLGFGDQLCEMNNIDIAHSTGRSIMKAIRRSAAKEFPMIVNQRPYDVEIDGTITKDGDFVYQTKRGKALGTVKLMKVLDKGCLRHLQILAIGDDVVLGRSGLELAETLKKHSPKMTLRVMPKVLCDHLLRRQDKGQVRALMQLSGGL